MTQQKKLKRAIRARARKTGESYAAARRQVVQAGRKVGLPVAAARPVASAPRPAAPSRPRSGEAGVFRKTGHGYDHWFAVLDTFGAPRKGHTASAAHLHREHGVPGWHSQMITVAYERERGLRVPNQSAAGDFQVNVSKSIPVPLTEVVDALTSPRRRSAWLRGADPALGRALRAAVAGPQARPIKVRDARLATLRYPWDRGRVQIYIEGRANGRTNVVASMTKLAGPAEVEQRRAQWRRALEGLKAHLTS
jgi:hypothetical protein